MGFESDPRAAGAADLVVPARCALAVAALALLTLPAAAGAGGRGGFCSRTADLRLTACQAERTDRFLATRTRCLALPEASQRRACLEDAGSEADEADTLCHEAHRERARFCALLGEGLCEGRCQVAGAAGEPAPGPDAGRAARPPDPRAPGRDDAGARAGPPS